MPGGSVHRARAFYSPAERADWLGKLKDRGARFRAEALYAQLDLLRELRPITKAAMMVEARRDPAWEILRTIPFLGPVRVSLLLATMRTPWRFRTKRNLWAYGGLAVVMRSSADHDFVEWQAGPPAAGRRRIGNASKKCHDVRILVYNNSLVRDWRTHKTGTPWYPSPNKEAMRDLKAIRGELQELNESAVASLGLAPRLLSQRKNTGSRRALLKQERGIPSALTRWQYFRASTINSSRFASSMFPLSGRTVRPAHEKSWRSGEHGNVTSRFCGVRRAPQGACAAPPPGPPQSHSGEPAAERPKAAQRTPLVM